MAQGERTMSGCRDVRMSGMQGQTLSRAVVEQNGVDDVHMMMMFI